MAVTVLLISHENIGAALLEAVTRTFGSLPLRAISIPIHHDIDREALRLHIRNHIQNLHEGDGVLILADLFGSTPCNLARELQDHPNVRIITGVNLPMLIRVMNYPQCSLEELASKALSGGKDGVLNCAAMT